MKAAREDEMPDKIKRLKKSLQEVTKMVDEIVKKYEILDSSHKKTSKSSTKKSSH